MTLGRRHLCDLPFGWHATWAIICLGDNNEVALYQSRKEYKLQRSSLRRKKNA